MGENGYATFGGQPESGDETSLGDKEEPLYSSVEKKARASGSSSDVSSVVSDAPPPLSPQALGIHPMPADFPMLGDHGEHMFCQLFGVLQKKPYGHQSTRWAKRFFVLRDGYLLYYAQEEKKDFVTRKFFNIHPKGAVTLGGAHVVSCEESGHPFSLRVTHKNLEGTLVLAAESEFEREKWVGALNKAARITFQNAQLGDAMISRLENDGLRMAHEKQEYCDKLRNESEALQSEKEKNEELARQAQEFKEQREQLEQLAEGLKSDHDNLRRELEETSGALKSVDEEKGNLKAITEALQTNIEELQHEKRTLSRDRQQHSSETENLKERLAEIERRTRQLEQEKEAAKSRLKDAEHLASQLTEEKTDIMSHTQQLQHSLKELTEKKAEAERELREEAAARREAEQQLRAAQASLTSLDTAVRDRVTSVDSDVKTEMIANVRSLKAFFEHVALESIYDANKPQLMKNAVSTCKTDTLLRRARTIRIEGNKRKSRLQAQARTDAFSASLTLPTRGKKSTRPPLPMRT